MGKPGGEAVFRILAIEDNLDHQELLRLAFEACEDRVLLDFFETAEEALVHLLLLARRTRDSSDLPDLVLIDVSLPGRSGISFLREFKADPRFQVIPAVMLSSSRSSEDSACAYRNNANSYLTKPVRLDELIELAQAILVYWGRHNLRPAIPRIA